MADKGKTVHGEAANAGHRVLAGEAERRQRGGETIEVVRTDIERRDTQRAVSNRDAEVHPDAAMRAPGERDVAMAHADAHADGRDPQERSLDAPRRDVLERRLKVEAPEPCLQALRIDLGPRGLRRRTEQGANEPPRTGADANRKASGDHGRKSIPPGRYTRRTEAERAAG